MQKMEEIMGKVIDVPRVLADLEDAVERYGEDHRAYCEYGTKDDPVCIGGQVASKHLKAKTYNGPFAREGTIASVTLGEDGLRVVPYRREIEDLGHPTSADILLANGFTANAVKVLAVAQRVQDHGGLGDGSTHWGNALKVAKEYANDLTEV